MYGAGDSGDEFHGPRRQPGDGAMAVPSHHACGLRESLERRCVRPGSLDAERATTRALIRMDRLLMSWFAHATSKYIQT